MRIFYSGYGIETYESLAAVASDAKFAPGIGLLRGEVYPMLDPWLFSRQYTQSHNMEVS